MDIFDPYNALLTEYNNFSNRKYNTALSFTNRIMSFTAESRQISQPISGLNHRGSLHKIREREHIFFSLEGFQTICLKSSTNSFVFIKIFKTKDALDLKDQTAVT